jgi:hypothetical protein
MHDKSGLAITVCGGSKFSFSAQRRLPLGADSAGLFSFQYCPANVCVLITDYIRNRLENHATVENIFTIGTGI